jgi:putative nucleotidyltransferase with HDIG domain
MDLEKPTDTIVMNILICDSNKGFANDLSNLLTENRINVSLVANGKDCQVKLAQSKHDVLVLDAMTQSHTAVEVINYVRTHHLKTRVVLTFENQTQKMAIDPDGERAKKMGVTNVGLKDLGAIELVKSIFFNEGLHLDEKSAESPDEIQAELFEMAILDGHELLVDTAALFDYFVYVDNKTYKRILRKGEVPKKAIGQTVFFRIKDRSLYVQFMNSLLSKSGGQEISDPSAKFQVIRSVVDQYISEFYTKGMSPNLVDEGKKICMNMFTMVSRDSRLKDILRTYEEKCPTEYSKTFLVAFFSTLIARSLPWGSQRTVEMVAMGGLLHDIGVPVDDFYLLATKPERMSASERARYESHPKLGVDILKLSRDVPEAVSQIVYQHHELLNGEGFPNKLSGTRIYPLAKIVSLSVAFTEEMINLGVSPMQALKGFIGEKSNFEKYDQELMKALIKCFIKEKS